MSVERFDVVCLGGGTAGMVAARAARAKGRSVALVERNMGAEGLGGDCTHWGCVPSKALIEVARAAHQSRALASLGFPAPELNFARIMERKDHIVSGIAHDERAELFERDGIDVLGGEARMLGPRHIAVGTRELVADRVVIATGSEPSVPPIPGLRETRHLTNRTIFSLRDLPDRLLVLGGGPIGLELAQTFRRFGSEVAVVELVDRLLPREEPEAGETLAQALREEGVELHLGTRAEHVSEEDGTIVVSAAGPGGGLELRGDTLLVAVGRSAGTATLGFEEAGVATDERGFVKVDEQLRTSAHGVYAAGDAIGGLMFTHVSAYEGRVAGDNAVGARRKVDYRVVPWAVFTDPEIGRVGLTEGEARERHGDDVDAVTIPMRLVDRARISGAERGFVKLVTLRRGRLGATTGGKLLGAHIVGPGAGELVHEAVIAMQTRAFTGRLAQAIHAYPSLSLGLQQAAAQLFPEGRAQMRIEDGSTL